MLREDLRSHCKVDIFWVGVRQVVARLFRQASWGVAWLSSHSLKIKAHYLLAFFLVYFTYTNLPRLGVFRAESDLYILYLFLNSRSNR